MSDETLLLEKWKIDYQDYWLDVKGRSCEEISAYLLDHLRWCWHDIYEQNTPFKSDIVESPEGELTYQFDTEMVMDGETCLKAGRLVAVYGKVGEIAGLKLTSEKLRRRYLGATKDWLGPEGIDKGHFIGHTLGGSSNMVLFPQRREVNRGWSEEGKKYQAMERYARENKGIMIFNRPIYSDESSWPRFFEFGLLKTDGELWVELFDNERPEGAVS